jgi:hypothetical protein
LIHRFYEILQSGFFVKCQTGILGPVFLQRGIMVNTDEMIHFLKKQPETFRNGCSDIIFDGKTVDRGFLMDGEEFTRSGFIFLKIIIIA